MGETPQAARRLIAGADILVENFRPGVLEKPGLGWEVLKADNAGLAMVRLSGFGQSGSYKGSAGLRSARPRRGAHCRHAGCGCRLSLGEALIDSGLAIPADAGIQIIQQAGPQPVPG